MNTTKQINVMIGMIFLGLVGTFLYFLFDNGFNIAGVEFVGREKAAGARQEMVNAERGAFLFARNCRSCHGNTGTGALERSGLPGAPLNIDSTRPPTLAITALRPRQARLNSTIHCGRVGTVMPAWSTDEGGPLNDFQIEQIVTLITSEDFSVEGWEFAVEEANHADRFDPRKFLVGAVGEVDETIEVTSVEGLVVEEESELLIRLSGEHLEDPYEVMLVTEVDADTNTLTVERGAAGTDPREHEDGGEVWQGPIPPSDTITGAEGSTAPCGQRNAPATPDPDAAEPVALAGVDEIVMGDNFFEADGTQNPPFTLAAGESVTLVVNNTGAAIHNLRTEGTDGEYESDDDAVSDPDLVNGGETAEIEIAFDVAGTYAYRCDFHPVEMAGEITVE